MKRGNSASVLGRRSYTRENRTTLRLEESILSAKVYCKKEDRKGLWQKITKEKRKVK